MPGRGLPESVETVEPTVFGEYLGVEFDRKRCGEQAGCADDRQLFGDRVRRRIRAKKETGVA